MKRSQIKKLDSMWAKLVKIKAGGKCEYCLEEKRQFKGGPGIWLEAAHIIGRVYRATRWNIENGLGLCTACHSSYDQHLPLEHDIRTYLIGEDRYQKLRSIPKVKAIDQVFEDEAKRLSEESKRLADDAQHLTDDTQRLEINNAKECKEKCFSNR